MATRPTLPYFAPKALLPARLPTVDEIRTKINALSVRRRKFRLTFGEHFIVKAGPDIRLQEGENMLFVQQSTNIPVPKVYAIFHDEETNMNIIIHEYIPGKFLSRVWDELSEAEKQAIVSRLRHHIDELRSIPSPGYYGGVWRQPVLDVSFRGSEIISPCRDSRILGPHETDEQWAEAMWLRVAGGRLDGLDKPLLPVLRQQYHDIFEGHKPVFTHADLSPYHILIREDGTVAIIDWGSSGWYPDFWEYGSAIMLAGSRWCGDWGEWVSKVLDPYTAQAGWMKLFRERVNSGYDISRWIH